MTENLAPILARISGQLTELRAAADRIERNQADPEEIRQALSDIASSWVLIGQMAEVLRVANTELQTFRAWREARMSGPELKEAIENVLFVSEQLGSILNGYRNDLLAMRQEIRRLGALQDIALSQLPTDEEPSRVPDDIRAVIRARRTGRQRMNTILIAVLAARQTGERPPDLRDELHALQAADAQTVAALEKAVGSDGASVG